MFAAACFLVAFQLAVLAVVGATFRAEFNRSAKRSQALLDTQVWEGVTR